jgi:hypothetical protein
MEAGAPESEDFLPAGAAEYYRGIFIAETPPTCIVTACPLPQRMVPSAGHPHSPSFSAPSFRRVAVRA